MTSTVSQVTQQTGQQPAQAASAGPPMFQRAPRIYAEVPTGEVELPRPTHLAAAPTGSLVYMLAPRLSAVGGLGVSIFTAASGRWEIAAIALLFTLVTTGMSIWMYMAQRRGHGRSVTEREKKFRAALDARKQELVALRDRQREALQLVDPGPAECLDRVQRLDRRMWERSPQDADFLSVRLGLGSAPSSVVVKAPRQEATVETDPLLDEAQKLAAEFSQVPDAPVRLGIAGAGAVGIAGSRSAVLEAARAIALQVATHHAPDEVKICAIFPNDERKEWDWMRWLPHSWSDDRSRRYLASDRESAGNLLRGLYEILSRRRAQASTPYKEQSAPPPLPTYILFLADGSLVGKSPTLRLLLDEGRQLGAYPVFLTDSVDDLPRGCNAIVDLTPVQAGQQAQIIQTAPARGQNAFAPDEVPADLADHLARSMAPVRLRSVAVSGEIPDSVTLLDLLGARSVEEIDALRLWRSGDSYDSLAVPVGRRAGDEPVLLDLHERGYGPHGLVAGTTGSGKSELLQTLIISLATHFHPHELAFMLVDFKGGETARVFDELPHLVGTLTNLEGNLAARAVVALEAEVRRRQGLLASTGRSHADYLRAYHQGQVQEPLPHLVLIVDEFAELAASQPDLIKQLVSTARVGRSLGVHLILATQKPAGVVNDQIWSNTRFRICLRVERPEDSREVLKRPDAASITQAGRAYLQVGNNEIFELFQSAWSGAPYVPGETTHAPQDDIAQVALDGTRQPLMTAETMFAATTGEVATSTQLEAMVAHLRDAARQAGIARLPGPWAPPLPTRVPLAQVRQPGGWDGKQWQPAGGWMEPVVGLLDDPTRQHQGPLSLNLGKSGHLLVYGGPGSGKTTFLRTIITSLALSHSPEDLNIYVLDFGGRALTPFAALPHSGGVVLPDESERVGRLIRDLLKEMETRQERFATIGAGTLSAYRNATHEKLPAIVLVLDNYSSFASAYQEAVEPLAQIAREGAGLGLYLIVSAHGPGLVPPRVAGNITQVVTLPMADKSDYVAAMGQTLGPLPPQVAGRGLLRASPPIEFQAALPAEGENEVVRTGAIRALAQQMDRAWTGERARPVRVLPDVVPLSELVPASRRPWAAPPADGTMPAVVGIDAETLDPVEVSLRDASHLLVTGPAQSGKTTLLHTLALSLAERYSPEHLSLFLVDFQRTSLLPLRGLPQVSAYIDTDGALSDALARISEILRGRRQALDEARRATGDVQADETRIRYPALVLIIDDFDAVRDQAQAINKTQLEQLVRRERGLGVHLVVAGSTYDLGSGYEGLAKALKELQTGFVLGSTEQPDTQILGLRLPLTESGKALPAGLGYYVRRGRGRKTKIAAPQGGTAQLREWVAGIAARRS